MSVITPPHFRLWTPTGDLFPDVGASAVGFGKALTDIESKWYNKDAWRLESFHKRDKASSLWVDPSASKNSKGATIAAILGYDNVESGVQYRGRFDDSYNHNFEVAYNIPQQEGSEITQRVKIEGKTNLNETEVANTNLFFKVGHKAFTTETILKVAGKAPTTLNQWIQGEVSPTLGYGGLVSFNLGSSSIAAWEAGLLNVFRGVWTRAVVRDGKSFEIGVRPGDLQVSDLRVASYIKTNYSTEKKTTDFTLATEVKAVGSLGLDVKAKATLTALETLSTAFAVIWNAPNNFKVAVSLAQGAKTQIGVRIAQGSTPAPI